MTTSRACSLFLPVTLILAVSISSHAAPPVPDYIAQAVADPGRPDADRLRDADRKPAEVLTFFGIQPGDRILDVIAGSGYYTHILSRAVGASGTVYAHNTPTVLEKFVKGRLAERLKSASLANVQRLDVAFEALEPPKDLDAVLIVLFYHDLYWQKIDRPKLNAKIFAALKPGGLYGIVDHHAPPGSGARDVESLHRVDAELVKKEILAAGFVLEAQSSLLRHAQDPRTDNVFKNRGKSDRFIYKFRKP